MKTYRFTGKDAKKEAAKLAKAKRAEGKTTYEGKRLTFVPKAWQKPDYEYMVDVTEENE